MDQAEGYIDTVRDDGSVGPLKIETHTLIAQEQLAKNVSENILRDVPRFHGRPGFAECRHESIAIVGAGPTLRETVDKLREFEHILVCGSAHDFVVRAGIVPTYALVSDGGKEDKGNLSLPQAETIYILASQCGPGLFDHLADHKVEMWHYRGQCATDPKEEAEILKGEPAISWGSTVTINAVQMAMLLGFQDLHFFGFDSCYGDYGMAHHCCDISGALEYKKFPAKIGDQEFISDLGLMEQANQFFKLVEVDGQFFHSTIYGDGLIAAMVRHGDPALSTFVSLA